MGGRIPERFIEDLLARVDIVEVIDERVPLRKAGKNYQALCPFHDEKTPSFSVSPEKQFYYCFGCGASGSALGFLMDYGHMDFVEAVHELASRAGLEVPHEGGGLAPQAVQQSGLYDLLTQVQRYYARQLRDHAGAARAVDYLKGRGLTGEIAAEYGLGFAPPGWDNLLNALGASPEAREDLTRTGMLIRKDDGGFYDRFRDRIMFPIHDQRGRVIGFGGRILDQGEPKYLNSPETPVFHKGRELYGLFQARKARRDIDRLLVVEGYMDVLALAQYGVRNAVATLGTATTADHLERLFRVAPDVVFCFDGDEAGRKAAWRALEVSLPTLREGRYVGFLFMPEGEDPDSLVRKQGAGVFSDAEALSTLSDFMFDTLSRQANLSTLDGRARLVDLASPLLGKIPPGAFKQLLVKRLATLSRLDTEELAPHVGVGSPTQPARKPRPVPLQARRSPSLVRTAITLLLHSPALAREVEHPQRLTGLDMAGIPLLVQLLELAQRHPNISCGGIVEHFRGSEEEKHLAKLAGQELSVPDDGIKDEFAGALARLRQLKDRQRREQLLGTRPSELTEAERTELNELLAARSGVPQRARSGSE